MESRTQGSRPRTPKKSEAKAKDSLSEDRHSRGQGQGPRTQAQVLSKKEKGLHKKFSGNLQKKKVFTKIFQAISTKKRFSKNFSSAPQNFKNSKHSAVLEPRTGQFSRTSGLEAKDFKMCPRGQGRPRGLHLCRLILYVYQRDSRRICQKFLWKFVSCFKQCGIITDMISCYSYVKDKDNHTRQIGIK